MTELVDGSALAELVLGYRHVAFRLETRERYNEAEEIEPLAGFLAGEPGYAWNDDWVAMMREHVASGRRMQRVRVVSEPHSDYTRFNLDLARVNVPAGEDIRYLPRHRAGGVDLPDHDFWLIDSTMLAILRFGEDDAMVGAEVIDDPAVVVRHCYHRDVAWHYAIPYAEYVG